VNPITALNVQPTADLPPASDPAPSTFASPLKLTIVIVNYNTWPDVGRLVATLAETPEVAAGAAEVIVVDNHSSGPIPPLFVNPPPGVRLVTRTENAGFAAGVNCGWRSARSGWILVLNPDVVVAADWLRSVLSRVDRFDTHEAAAPGIVGFGLRNPDGSRQPSVGAFPSLRRTLFEQLIPRPRRKYQADWRTHAGPVPWVTGACMLINSHLLDALGGMDDDFFLYYEEVALCRAAQTRGWRVEFDPSIGVTHLRPLQNRAISPKMRVITRHSKLLYFRKHLPHWQFLALSWIISLQATLLGFGSQLRRRTEDARSWRTIGEVARAFRAGRVMRGRDVLALADSVQRSCPSGVDNARKRRGARRPRLLS
jgi:GT2 family glycosyltransferase